MMTRIGKWHAAGALLVALAVVPGGAHAAVEATEGDSGATVTLVNGQTPAGTLVTNDAVLAYAVGTVPQDEIAASASGNAATFEVDRRLDVNVSRNGGLKSGTPGGVAELLFTVTNETNDTATDLFLQALRYDSDLAPVNSARVAATPLPGSTTRVCLDANANGQCEVGEVLGLVAGQGYLVPSAAAVPGTALDIVLEVSVPVSAVNGSWDSFLLSASVGDGTGLARIATDDRLLEDVATGENAVQNVFADADSSLNDAAGAGIVFGGVSLGTDSVSDGIHTDADQFQVATAVMSVVKLSEVIYDPINGLKYALVASGAGATVDTGSATGANPKAIPGAIVMYTISAQNDRDNVETAPSAATAQTVTITDTLPTELIAGNDAALTGLADCNVDGVGVLGTGTICTANLTDLATRLDVALVTQCGAATPAPIDILAENPLAAVDLGSCTDADDSVGQEGTIVYYVTIP